VGKDGPPPDTRNRLLLEKKKDNKKRVWSERKGRGIFRKRGGDASKGKGARKEDVIRERGQGKGKGTMSTSSNHRITKRSRKGSKPDLHVSPLRRKKRKKRTAKPTQLHQKPSGSVPGKWPGKLSIIRPREEKGGSQQHYTLNQ